MKLPVVLALSSVAAFAASNGVELTIYNNDLALVKDQRTLDLKKGRQQFAWEGVAQTLDASSATFSANSAYALEQNYRFDLVSRSVLLNKYLGKEVTLVQESVGPDGKTSTTRITGRILSVEGERISALDVNGKVLLDPPGRVELPSLPDGLLVKPSLVLDVESPKGGSAEAELRYLCGGLSWNADYVVTLDAKGQKVDVDGLVTLNNRSGTSFRDARLKLVAGDVNRVQEEMPRMKAGRAAYATMDLMEATAAPPQFQESSLLEYHLYDLQRPATVLDREQKQVNFLTARGATARKRFVFDQSFETRYWWWYQGQDTREGLKLGVILDVENKEANKLGMPLPKGKIRVFQADNQGSLQFVGEDQIDHTPRDQTLHLALGQAFDILGKRVIESSDTKGTQKTETVAVTLKNSKDEAVEVEVVEHQQWPRWKVKESSLTPEKVDASTLLFRVKVPARGEATVRYTYQANWN